MKQILFLNHSIKNCGVYQYGLRVYDIIKATDNIHYIYKELSSLQEYKSYISENKIDAIIYNYHIYTMSWLNSETIQKKVKNIGIHHEHIPYHFFDIICDTNPGALENSSKFSLPRPIFENIDTLLRSKSSSPEVDTFINAYQNTGIPIFGSFGFGFDNKGFDKAVKLINLTYDNAVIKFVIPVAHFDPNTQTAINMKKKCLHANLKEGIKIIITHDFFSTDDILRFLGSNTMNIFLYDTLDARGISSTIDYALSVKKPIGISDSYMFRNIYNDNICLYKVSIEKCLQNSTEHCKQFLEKYSHANMINKFKDIIERLN
jgi:hypothetical protein